LDQEQRLQLFTDCNGTRLIYPKIASEHRPTHVKQREIK